MSSWWIKELNHAWTLYELPQVLQVVALHVLQEEPCELENSLSLLWEKAERSFLILLPLQVGQDTSSLPNTKISKSLSHSVQWYSNIGMSDPYLRRSYTPNIRLGATLVEIFWAVFGATSRFDCVYRMRTTWSKDAIEIENFLVTFKSWGPVVFFSHMMRINLPNW